VFKMKIRGRGDGDRVHVREQIRNTRKSRHLILAGDGAGGFFVGVVDADEVAKMIEVVESPSVQAAHLSYADHAHSQFLHALSSRSPRQLLIRCAGRAAYNSRGRYSNTPRPVSFYQTRRARAR